MAATLSKNTQFAAGVNAGINTVGGSGITPTDSGTILGTVPPGQAGLKLTDGTQQSATTRTSDQTAGVRGNFYGPSQDSAGNLVQNTTYQGQSKGYSLGLE